MLVTMRHFCFVLVAILAVAIPALPASGAVTFLFDYGTGTVGFNDPTEGAARRASLENAASSLGSLFAATATVTIDAFSLDDSGSGTLAYAGSSFSTSTSFRGYLRGVVGEKILSGTDRNGANADGQITVNFGWNWDLDDDVASDALDFKAIATHELLHAVGFVSGIEADGTDGWGFTENESTAGGGANGGVWTVFDDFVVDAAGNPVIDDTGYHIDLTNWNANSVGGAAPTDGLFFSGANAVAANGGNLVGLYTPTTFSPGSSVSHLDTDFKPFEDHIMSHSISLGPQTRTLSDIEKGMLTDFGFTIVPEPSTGILLLIAQLWLTTRRRRPLT